MLPNKLKEVLQKKQSLSRKNIHFPRRVKLKCQFREINLTHVFQKPCKLHGKHLRRYSPDCPYVTGGDSGGQQHQSTGPTMANSCPQRAGPVPGPRGGPRGGPTLDRGDFFCGQPGATLEPLGSSLGITLDHSVVPLGRLWAIHTLGALWGHFGSPWVAFG